MRIRSVLAGALLIVLAVPASATTPTSLGVSTMLLDDTKYLIDNVQLDAKDVAAAPFQIADESSVVRSPRFYLVLAGAGALWGGAFALDQTMRGQLRNMSSGDADLLQDVSYASLIGSTVALYGYGLSSDDIRARHYVLTSGESAAIASLAVIGIKAAFGRLRPHQDQHSHTKFFDGGASFVSGDVTPMFSLATGISEYFENTWYIAAPAYSLALLDGFGRMGHDAHWFSDVVGAALVGSGTTELLLYLHRKHEAEPTRWRIFPLTTEPNRVSSRVAEVPTGISIAYTW